MVSDESKLARTTRSEAEPAGAAAASATGDATGAEIELALADLVADANGEIVVFNDSGYRSLAIRTDRLVVADGHAGAHLTAAGVDVSGFQFVRFDNGLTLYVEAGLHLILPSAPASPPS
jgi:predicted TIM-barrel enzyme